MPGPAVGRARQAAGLSGEGCPDALLDALAREEPLAWWNPRASEAGTGLAASGIDPAVVDDAAARLERFRPWIARAFPETAGAGGLIESPLEESLRWREEACAAPARVLLKRDDVLPVSGSVKARGGVHEVLQHAESLAVAHGLLPDPGTAPAQDELDYSVFGTEAFQRLMGGHRVVVGSTGNLGLSVGIMASALGLGATVHMSVHAQQWKKDLLRSRGVQVVEHGTDYTSAVAAGRAAAEDDEFVHFVDDEHSISLFSGYAVAGRRLAAQLDDLDIHPDRQHPLVVHLPCGIGGAPGGVAYGLKQEFGDAVQCVFVEPTQAPCMLLGLCTGRHDGVSVADLGLSTRTVADGLAVGRPSGFVGRAVGGLISGVLTAGDGAMTAEVRALHATEGVVVEPSAAAALVSVRHLADGSEGRGWGYLPRWREERGGGARVSPAGAVHLAWLTGGGMLPPQVRSSLVG